MLISEEALRDPDTKKKKPVSDQLIELTSQELVVEHTPQKQVSGHELLHQHETPTPTRLLGRMLLT